MLTLRRRLLYNSFQKLTLIPSRIPIVSRFLHQTTTDPVNLKSSYDVIVVGAGHNGLVSAAYLQKAGYSVCVLEQRNIIGGAAVTEEIVPGFKFSRASYLCSLLRPFIISDLKLKEHGLKFYYREPFCSYTPIRESLWGQFPAKSLLLSSNLELSQKEISKFSTKDAENYGNYEREMGKYLLALNHILDNPPPRSGKLSVRKLKELSTLLKAFRLIGVKSLAEFQELLTSPASKILNKWFESEPLKCTLATDAVIGAMQGPHSKGNGYVLLHHIMGGVDGIPGAWAYVEGGMGGVSTSICSSAMSSGAEIFTSMGVDKLLYSNQGSNLSVSGVVTKSGIEIEARKAILSGTTPHVTFNQLLRPQNDPVLNSYLGRDFIESMNSIDYTSPVTKINVAVDKIPQFLADPGNKVSDWHKCSIHLNCENMEILSDSYESCIKTNMPSKRPMIEMVIPSSLDPTLAPEGAHVCLFFTQYTPYSPSTGSWTDPAFKESYAQKVFDIVEEYCPGFKTSIVGKEVLSPWDLEQTFNLTGGNIFHGAMSLDQLYFLRPIRTSKCNFPETPLRGLYLCGSGCHPGGGVMGLPGYLAAKALIGNRS